MFGLIGIRIGLMDPPAEIVDLHNWLSSRDYNYYALNSWPEAKYLNHLFKKCNFLGVIWRQLFRLSPINFRPLFFLADSELSPKAPVHLAQAYLELWRCFKLDEFKESWELCLERVLSLRSNRTRNFAVRHVRDLFVLAYQASIQDVAPLLTAWAGQLFLRAYETFGDSKYLELAKSVANYFIEEHPKDENEQHVYFYYHSNLNDKIYNNSAVIASFLIQLGSIASDIAIYKYGKKGLDFIMSAQQPAGFWFYGEKAYGKYVDNFHTAFILLALYESIPYCNDNKVSKSFKNGLRYYIETLFKKTRHGLLRPIHFDPRFIPLNSNAIQRVDIRDAALSIILFSVMSEDEKKYLKDAESVLQWTYLNMKKNGHYFTEITWLWKNRIPYIEFQAWMLLSMAIYFKHMNNRES